MELPDTMGLVRQGGKRGRKKVLVPSCSPSQSWRRLFISWAQRAELGAGIPLFARIRCTIPRISKGTLLLGPQATMSSKFSAWIGTKVEQLLGMPEPSLVEYVTELLASRSPPAKTHDELLPVLDADSETFVMKLYRMVIYETEKAHANL